MVPREARATDTDGDGWDTTGTPADCDDAAVGIHPAAPEDPTNDDDEDCDDSVLAHRSYTSAMAGHFGTEFTLGTGAALTTAPNGDDILRFTRGATASVTMDDDFTFNSGEFTLMLSVKTYAGPPCDVTVTSSSMAASTKSFVGTGIKVLSWPYDIAVGTGLPPGDTVTDLSIGCTTGTGTVEVDWITIANGPALLGPLFDVSAQASTMGLPGMGRQSVVRSSFNSTGAPGLLQFVGSDVGGFGWTDDGVRWNAANGTGSQWLDGGELGVWEVWARDESSLATQTVLVLTGDKDSGDGGGLYYTDNLDSVAQVWTDAGGSLGASKHLDDCSNLDEKPIGSGQLIVHEPNETSADTSFLIASSDPDTTGLYTWTKGGAAVAVQTFNGTLPTGIPSALAVDSSGEFVLVGYRPLVGATDEAALYLCPADFDAATVYDCELVVSDTVADGVWAGDVRDIEADPIASGVFYVADGGRRAASSTTCTAGESTVFVVEATGTFAASDVAANIDDTDDDTSDFMPSWGDDTTLTTDVYYDGGDIFDNCADNNHPGAATYGELVPPRGGEEEGYELSSIAVDPAGEWLFAFYPLPDLKRDYGCVRTFRTLVAGVVDSATPWKPFQGWTMNGMDFYDGSANAAARRAAVDVTGATSEYDAFMIAEPLLEDWAGAGTHDAAFAYNGTDYDLMLGGNFVWRVLPDDTVLSGWNTTYAGAVSGTTLDSAQWELVWDGESAVFQDSIVNSVIACPGCFQSGAGLVDLVIAAGVSDYKMARMYGSTYADPREAADRPCEVHMLDSSGKDVAMWSDGTGGGQAWMSLINQADEDDSTWDRGVLFLDDITGDDWCWDSYEATTASGIANPNYINDWWIDPSTYDAAGDDIYELMCQDSAELANDAATPAEYWSSCRVDDPTAVPAEHYYDQMELADIGQVVSLVAFASDTALLVAAPAMPDGGSTAGGEGLWLAQYTGTTGIEYTEVPFETAGVTFGSATCTEAEFFAWASQVQIVFDETSYQTGTSAHAWLTSLNTDCGVLEVEFDVTDPTDTSTTSWGAIYPDTSITTCDLDVSVLRGVAANRDASWLFVFGGPDTTAADGGVCAIDLVGTAAAEEVVDGDVLDIQIETMIAHPQVDDAFYFGGFTAEGSADPGGVYGLQRRYNSSSGTWSWGWKRLSGNDLEHRAVLDLAWGPGQGAPDGMLRDLYVATSGGGVWDLRISSF